MGPITRIERLWDRLRGYPQARELTLGELVSLLQSEVERGIDAADRRTDDGTVVEATSVDVEVPLGLATNPGADEGVETDAGGGLTTTVNLDVEAGGGDGRLTVRFGLGPGATPPPTRPAEPDEDSARASETPQEAVEASETDAVDGLADASIRTVEDVADAGESAAAEATDVAEGDAERVVDVATAASLGASHDTARVLAALRIGIDDLASTTPVELLSTIEDGVESRAVSVESSYETDVRELATVVGNAERAVDEASGDTPGSGPGGDG